MYFGICVISIVLSIASSAERGSVCITPNGENATCISIQSCDVIKQALIHLQDEAIAFARKSQCGYDEAPLVCCGSVGHTTTVELNEAHKVPAAATSSPIGEPVKDAHLPDHSLCGIHIRNDRIVGGRATEVGEFPWMVALKYKKQDGSDGGFRCGGTLINNKFVLTAAQCLFIREYTLTGVRLGEWKFSTLEDCYMDTEHEEICTDPPLDLAIVQQIPHPFYSKRSGNNDIALLLLEKKVKYNDYVRPICLPPADLEPPDPGVRLEISGWGLTETGSQSDVKLKVEVPYLKNEECVKVFLNSSHINPNQACAGGEEGKDACSGDSGGPLMRTFQKKNTADEPQWYQEGIIYRGLGCGRKGVPSLYTRVSRYTQWILNNLH